MSLDDLWPMLRSVLTTAVLLGAMWDACREKKPRGNAKSAAEHGGAGRGPDKEEVLDAEYEVLP